MNNSLCLINQSACGRIAGNPVCPKCGMDERVVYPGQADLDTALASARERYVADSSIAGVNERSSPELQQSDQGAPVAVFMCPKKGGFPVVVGETHEGTVAKILDFGAVVRLVDGVEGLLHSSEIANVPPSSVAEVLRVGQQVHVKVIGIDRSGCAQLSIRALAHGGGHPAVDGFGDSSGNRLISSARHSSFKDVIRSYVRMAWGPIWLSSALSLVLIFADDIFQFFGIKG